MEELPYFTERIKKTLYDFSKEDLINCLELSNKYKRELEYELQTIANNCKQHIQLIQTYTDDERVLAQCNLILEELK